MLPIQVYDIAGEKGKLFDAFFSPRLFIFLLRT